MGWWHAGAGTAGVPCPGDVREAERLRRAPRLHDPDLAGPATAGRYQHGPGHVLGRQEREPGALEHFPGVRDQRSVDDPGGHCVYTDAALFELWRDAAHEADHSVFGQRIDGVDRRRHQAGQRGSRDDRASRRHHAGEPARPEHDTVDVGAEDAAVGLVRNGCQLALAGRHPCVQAGQVDRSHLFPRLGVGDVEAVPQVEHLDLGSLVAEEGGDGGADPRSAAGDEGRMGEHRGIQY